MTITRSAAVAPIVISRAGMSLTPLLVLTGVGAGVYYFGFTESGRATWGALGKLVGVGTHAIDAAAGSAEKVIDAASGTVDFVSDYLTLGGMLDRIKELAAGSWDNNPELAKEVIAAIQLLKKLPPGAKAASIRMTDTIVKPPRLNDGAKRLNLGDLKLLVNRRMPQWARGKTGLCGVHITGRYAYLELGDEVKMLRVHPGARAALLLAADVRLSQLDDEGNQTYWSVGASDLKRVGRHYHWPGYRMMQILKAVFQGTINLDAWQIMRYGGAGAWAGSFVEEAIADESQVMTYYVIDGSAYSKLDNIPIAVLDVPLREEHVAAQAEWESQGVKSSFTPAYPPAEQVLWSRDFFWYLLIPKQVPDEYRDYMAYATANQYGVHDTLLPIPAPNVWPDYFDGGAETVDPPLGQGAKFQKGS